MLTLFPREQPLIESLDLDRITLVYTWQREATWATVVPTDILAWLRQADSALNADPWPVTIPYPTTYEYLEYPGYYATVGPMTLVWVEIVPVELFVGNWILTTRAVYARTTDPQIPSEQPREYPGEVWTRAPNNFPYWSQNWPECPFVTQWVSVYQEVEGGACTTYNNFWWLMSPESSLTTSYISVSPYGAASCAKSEWEQHETGPPSVSAGETLTDMGVTWRYFQPSYYVLTIEIWMTFRNPYSEGPDPTYYIPIDGFPSPEGLPMVADGGVLGLLNLTRIRRLDA